MYKSIASVTLFVILLSGCLPGAPAQDEAATTVAETDAPPTDTPLPSSTPPPTDTPTPVPTSTPDLDATSTAQAAAILSEISGFVDDEIPYQDGALVWQQTKSITINMSGPQSEDNFREIGENVSAGNFVFKSDVTWNASGILICGAIFRSEQNLDTGKQYQFYFYRLSGLPAYFIDVYEDGGFKNTISDAKFSGDLDVSNDGTNQFVLVAQEEQFVVYINGQRQGRYFDYSKQRAEGYFAFLAWQESGKGSCMFENSWIWSLD